MRALAVPCTFAGYINEWLTADIPTVLRSATALVPLKMETPVPFTGTWTDAEACLKEFYCVPFTYPSPKITKTAANPAAVFFSLIPASPGGAPESELFQLSPIG